MKAWIEKLKQARQKFTTKNLFMSCLVVVLIFSFGIGANAYSQKDVILIENGKNQKIVSVGKTVEDVLIKEGISLAPEDEVSPSKETKLRDGLEIKITRAFPVQIQVDGKKLEVKTTSTKVSELLKKANIALGAEDEISPKLDTVLTNEAKIVVNRIKTKEYTREKELAFKVERKENNKLDKGKTKVVQEGKPGLAKEIVKVTYKNGKELTRELVKTDVVKKPVNKIVSLGTRQVVSRGGQDLEFRKVMVAEATAYSTGSITATGAKPKRGVIAVDPSVIPLGTKVYVEGYGTAKALDTGGAIKGNKIDIFVDSKREARQWGRRNVKVYILK